MIIVGNKGGKTRCPVCAKPTARVTIVVSSKGTRRRKLVCMNPICRSEVG